MSKESPDEEKETCLTLLTQIVEPITPFDRFSNFNHLKRVTTWWLRFINNCLGKLGKPNSSISTSPMLTTAELHSSERYWAGLTKNMMILSLKSLPSNLTSLCRIQVHCCHYIRSLTRRDFFDSVVDKNIPRCHTPSVIHSFSMESTQSPNYSFGQNIDAYYMVNQVLLSPLSVVAFISSILVRQCDHLFDSVLLAEDEPSSPNHRCWDNFLQNGSLPTLSLKEWALIMQVHFS